MARVSFELDTKQLITVINATKGQVPKAAARALNKSAKSARTALVKLVREDLGLKAGDVRKEIKLEEARPSSDPVAKLRVSKKRIPLIKFGGTKLKRAGWRSRMKGGARTYPGAFDATIGGRDGVFRRKSKARIPTEELHGPSLAKVFVKHWGSGVKRFKEQLPKNLRSELRFIGRQKR